VTLEGRTLLADYNAAEHTLTVYHSTQAPHMMQDIISRHLDIPEGSVRVIARDVGGSYGIKVHVYPDEMATAALSVMLRRPVKFVADRLEAVKWKNWKIVFYEEQRDWWSPSVKLGNPKGFDLITDPKEEYPATAMRNTWNAGPALKVVEEFEKSLAKYPPIKPGSPDPYPAPAVKSTEKAKQ